MRADTPRARLHAYRLWLERDWLPEIQPARKGAPRPPLRILEGGGSPSAAAPKRRAKLAAVRVAFTAPAPSGNPSIEESSS